MNKKLFILSFLIPGGLLLMAVAFSFGDYPGEKIMERKAFVRFTKNIIVNHRDIQRISPYQNEANFVAVGSYESNAVTDAKIEYYINNDTSSVSILAFEEIKSPFVSGQLIVPSAGTFSYRFVLIENNNTADPKYYPYNSGEWIHVPVSWHVSKTMGAAGGNMILDNGDQRYGYSEIVLNPGALAADCSVKLSESDMNAFSGDKTGLVKLYELDSQYPLQKNAHMTLYYGSSNDGQFTVKYLDGGSWRDINSSQSQDALKKTISFYCKENGYYGIFTKTGGDNGGYRPKYRVFRFGEKLSFRNLEQGDSVTIFDINGRQIKKLTAQPFEWDGRRDNGSYAESGSYIYQIKVKGKIVSGSVAFVR